MSSFTARLVDVVVWIVVIAVVFTAIRLVSERAFPRADSHRLVAGLVTLGLVVGVLWPFSARLIGPLHVSQPGGGGSRPAIGDTIADGACQGTITGAGVGSIDGITVDATSGATATGWAVAADKSGLADAVCAVLDDTAIPSAVAYNGPRPDVAQAFGGPALTNSGFSTTIPASQLTSGMHTLTMLAKNGASLTIAATREFDVP